MELHRARQARSLAGVRSLCFTFQMLSAVAGMLLAGGALAGTTTYAYQSQFGSFGSGAGQFDSPVGVAIEPTTGNLVMGDSNFVQSRLELFTSTGVFVSEVSISFDPQSIAIDPTSLNVAVTDFLGNQVAVFTSTGSFSFGSAGSGNGQFDNPDGVAIDPKSHHIVVADGHNQRIQIFDSAGNYLSQFATIGAFADPVAVAIDPTTGNIFVTVEESLEVQEFDSAGNFLSEFGAGLFHGIPEGIAVDPATHNVFVSDTFGDQVLVFSQGATRTKHHPLGGHHGGGGGSYTLQTHFGSTGSGNGQFSQPVGIAVDPTSGNVIVVDEGNFRVEIFAPQ